MRHHDALQFYPVDVPPSFAWLPFQKNRKETPFAPEQTPSCVRLRDDTSMQKDFPYTTDVCHSQYECCDTEPQGTANMSLRTHSPSFPLIEIATDGKLHELAKWAELVGLSLPSWEEYLNDREGLASRRECTSEEYRGWPRRGQGDPAEWVDQSILTMVEALDYLMLGYDTATLHCIGMEPKKTVGKTAVDESAEYIKQCIANCAFRVAVRAVISSPTQKPSITINLQNLPFERESSAWLVDKMAKNCRRANLVNVQMASFEMDIQRTDKDGENQMKCEFGRKEDEKEKRGTLIFVSESEGMNSPWSVKFTESTGYARFSPLKNKQFRPTNAQIKTGVDQLMKVETRPLKARRITEEQMDPWPGTDDRETMTGGEIQGDMESFIMNATVINGLCSHIYKKSVTNEITNFYAIAVYCATQNPDPGSDGLKKHEWRQKRQETLLPDDHTPHKPCSIEYCDYWGISDEAVYRLPSTGGGMKKTPMIVYNRTKRSNTAQSEQIEIDAIA